MEKYLFMVTIFWARIWAQDCWNTLWDTCWLSCNIWWLYRMVRKSLDTLCLAMKRLYVICLVNSGF